MLTYADRMVQTYLVHHGYCATAEAFASSTGISFDKDLDSIKSRQSECREMRLVKYLLPTFCDGIR